MQAPKSPAELKARYPYQFNNPKSLGVSFARGWFKGFAQLCAEIDEILGEDKRGFVWAQVKEKFGSARFHFDIVGRTRKNAKIAEQILDLTLKAGRRTAKQCIVCGEPGEIRTDDGYMLCLCDAHKAVRGARWFYLEDHQAVDEPVDDLLLLLLPPTKSSSDLTAGFPEQIPPRYQAIHRAAISMYQSRGADLRLYEDFLRTRQEVFGGSTGTEFLLGRAANPALHTLEPQELAALFLELAEEDLHRATS